MNPNKRQYEFLYPLSKTSFADVYRCREHQGERVVRDVAIKILHENWADNQESVVFLRDEIALLQSLHHHNIPKIYEVTALRGRIAIVMEWIEGLDLKHLVQSMRHMKQRIPLKVTLSLVADIAETLDVIYNQSPAPGKSPLRILHGNLKPSNIIIDSQGKISLLDFGTNRSELGGRESATREMQFDAVEYIAPERLFFEPQGPASDIYSLSVTMFEMLAGKPLGKAPPSEEQHQARVERYCQHLLRPMPLGLEVKEELSSLLMSGLSYNAHERPWANDFASRARNLSNVIQGVEATQWSKKAIGYFQSRQNRDALQGTLQGSVLSEDTEVFQRPMMPEDPDVDTAIIRRGVVADFVEASLDLNPTAVVEMNAQKEPTESISFDSSELLQEPQLEIGQSAVSVPEPPQMPQMVSSHSIADLEAHTMTQVDPEGQTQTSTSLDIRPQAVVAPEVDVEQTNVSTSKLVMLFIGGAVLLMVGIVGVVKFFGTANTVPTSMTDSNGLTPTTISDSWDGARFVSKVENTRKIKVVCGDVNESGEDVVTIGSWADGTCVVTVRTTDRKTLRGPVNNVEAGLFECQAAERDLSCQKVVR
jgi:serine/threonine protein kinase